MTFNNFVWNFVTRKKIYTQILNNSLLTLHSGLSFTAIWGWGGGNFPLHRSGPLKPWHLKLTIFPKVPISFRHKTFFSFLARGQEMKACLGIEQSLLKTFIDVFSVKWKERKKEKERNRSISFFPLLGLFSIFVSLFYNLVFIGHRTTSFFIFWFFTRRRRIT